MSTPLSDPGHGHSPAAWTSVLLMIIGLSVATVALFLEAWVVLVIGLAIVVIGPIAGLLVSKAGYGVNGPKYKASTH